MKVLIADDELPIREWLRMSMEGIRESIEVHTAGQARRPGLCSRRSSRSW